MELTLNFKGVLYMGKIINKGAVHLYLGESGDYNRFDCLCKIAAVIARYTIDKEKGDTKLVNTTYVPRTKKFKEIMVHEIMRGLESTDNMDINTDTQIIRDDKYALRVIVLLKVNALSGAKLNKTYMDIIESPEFNELESSINVMPSDSDYIRKVKDGCIYYQKSLIDILKKYKLVE